MNILFICDEYPPGKHGGIGTMVQVLGRELVKQGHKVFVAGLYSFRHKVKEYEEDNGVKVWRFKYGLNIPIELHNKVYTLLEKLPDFVKSSMNGKRAFYKYLDFIRELIEKQNIDIIEIQDWNTFSFFIGFKIQWPPFTVPLILKSNGSYTYFAHEAHDTAKQKFFNIDQLLYSRADALSAVSHYTAELDKKLFRITKNIQILYNSIDVPEKRPEVEREPNRIIFTGSLLHKKGIFQLVKAWNIVHSVLPKAELFVYGKGNVKSLKKLLTTSAAKTVNFEGHVSREILYKQLSTATAAIFPSYSECFSFAPLEAMAAGCPIINTSRSSGKELVTDYKNGSLVDPDNIDEISQKIIELLKNKELQELYSEKGWQTVKEFFCIEKSAKDHVSFYQQIIANQKNSHERK